MSLGRIVLLGWFDDRHSGFVTCDVRFAAHKPDDDRSVLPSTSLEDNLHKAIVTSVRNWTDIAVVTEASRGLGEAMVGINVNDVPAPHRLAERGW